jgi:acetoin utilization protein AcuC
LSFHTPAYLAASHCGGIFAGVWQATEHLARFEPRFLLLQCAADSLEGDPITHLRSSAASHRRGTRGLCQRAEHFGQGRALAMGGGCNRKNIAQA